MLYVRTGGEIGLRNFKKHIFACSVGMEAIEGVIIMTILMFVLVFFMSFVFLLYQQTVVTNAANDAATRIAQSYAYPKTDPVMGYINRAMKISLSPFRYWGSGLADQNAQKGQKYANWYLSIASLASENGDPIIKVETEHDGLAQRHVEVDITAKYRIPMGGILSFIGVDPEVTFHATGRAPCIDLGDYIYTINMTNALTHETFGSKALGMVNSVLGLAQHIRDILASP